MAYDVFGQNYENGNFVINSTNGERRGFISSDDMRNVLAANGLFANEDIQLYQKFNRYGYSNPFNETDNREYLFFTKPDLNIFKTDGTSSTRQYNALELNNALKNIPIFTDAVQRYKPSLTQLQSSVNSLGNISSPFMTILTNTVTSRLDLPNISADVSESSSNMYTTAIQYRSHSLKSDNGYDFTLSFTDTKYLDVYMFFKAYEEYETLKHHGVIKPSDYYITRKILHDQFSIYKFIVSDDMETIVYYG